MTQLHKFCRLICNIYKHCVIFIRTEKCIYAVIHENIIKTNFYIKGLFH